MPAHPEPPPTRPQRITVVVATDVRDWVHAHMRPGGIFAVEGHAMEVAIEWIHGEQAYVKQECRRQAIIFNPEAFWARFAGFIEQAKPIPSGARPASGHRPFVERVRLQGTLHPIVLEHARKCCEPDGPFVNLSHAVETFLRYLRAQDLADRPIPGIGLPFDGKALMKSYLRAAKDLSAS
jgi:hypothetical protein